LDKIGYKTIRTWLEGITSSKYKWKGSAQSDIRFDELEGLANRQSTGSSFPKELGLVPNLEKPTPFQFKYTLPFYRRPFAIAATVAIVMVGLFHLLKPNDMKPYIAGPGQSLELKLPDGSLVFLNSGSKISYSKGNYREGDRTILLEGEAWFDVKKGGEFSVMSKNGYVEVLGTEFNVFSRGNEFEVICEEGRVKAIVGEESTLIGKGQGVKFDLGNRTFIESNNLKRSSWRKGVFYFESADIKTVFSEIDRQFGVQIINKGNADLMYTGVFKSGDLNQALDLVCKPLGLGYSIVDKDGKTSVFIR
jgi:transmembrane sensor